MPVTLGNEIQTETPGSILLSVHTGQTPFLTQEEVNGLLFQRKHTTIKALQAHQMQMLYFVVVSIPIVHSLVNRVASRHLGPNSVSGEVLE